MTDAGTLEILKSAILLETRGKSFYLKAAEGSRSPAVRDFFQMMADEEVSHIQILADQYKTYQASGKFAPGDYGQDLAAVAKQVLGKDLKSKMTAAGFEAAAVSAAMAMEERAIKLYSERAETATDPEEKALYEWLAAWEGQHLDLLAKIDREVTETVWNDNNFWPF